MIIKLSKIELKNILDSTLSPTEVSAILKANQPLSQMVPFLALPRTRMARLHMEALLGGLALSKDQIHHNGKYSQIFPVSRLTLAVSPSKAL